MILLMDGEAIGCLADSGISRHPYPGKAFIQARTKISFSPL
jgi:hypothetical protein